MNQFPVTDEKLVDFAVKTFSVGGKHLQIVHDEDKLFGCGFLVSTGNPDWQLCVEMNFHLVGGEDQVINDLEVLQALGINPTDAG